MSTIEGFHCIWITYRHVVDEPVKLKSTCVKWDFRVILSDNFFAGELGEWEQTVFQEEFWTSVD